MTIAKKLNEDTIITFNLRITTKSNLQSLKAVKSKETKPQKHYSTLSQTIQQIKSAALYEYLNDLP